MRLCSVTQSLQIGMQEGVTTNNLDFSIDYIRVEYPGRTQELNSLGVMPSGAYVIAVAAPDKNVYLDIQELNVYNADTVTHHVLVAIDDNGTKYVTHLGTLTAGQTLHYSKVFGWLVN